jgi:predicted  nucleic acid-binding Zn-ribbon protein
MNKYLKQLVELVEIDKKIDAFDPQVEKIKINLNAQLKKEQDLVDAIERLKEELQENKVSKSKNELYLTEFSEKIETLGKKSAAVKSEKEMKALQLEEEIAREQIKHANSEIERLDNSQEQKELQIKENEEAIESMKDSTSSIQADTEKELEKLEKERMGVYKEKDKLLSTMNQNIIEFYEKIRRWAKNTTVVPVKKQACYGCYMKLNDHTYASVIKGDEITTCPHCGRILFLEKEEEVEEEESVS